MRRGRRNKETPAASSLDAEAETASSESEREQEAEPEAALPESFAEMKLSPVLVEVLGKRGWSTPTDIQKQAIPPALRGLDVIGLAVTGSGKTGAFAIPVIQRLLADEQKAFPFYAVVVLPTRELCMQVANEFRALGSLVQLRVCALLGGMSAVEQTRELARQPHVVCASPGRLVDHIQNTKGFSLGRTKFLILDEADRLLSMDFEESLYEIVRACNPKRQTLLFSATMTTKLSKLQRACLRTPIAKIEVNEKTCVAKNLVQHIVLVPVDKKFEYLAALLTSINASRTMVFCNTCRAANVITVFLKKLNFKCVALAGDMNQVLRLNSLTQFKTQQKNILIATEVAARGMDLPDVNFVINFDVPTCHKDYIHRVGRTARAGKSGKSFTFVSKLDVVQYKLIEEKIFGDDATLLPKVYSGDVGGQTIDAMAEVLNQSLSVKDAKLAAEKEYADGKRASSARKRARKR